MNPIRQTPPSGRRLFLPLHPAVRLRAALLLLGAGVAAYGLYRHFVTVGAETPRDVEELRMPVANPVLEPDRPDLLSEPRIDE